MEPMFREQTRRTIEAITALNTKTIQIRLHFWGQRLCTLLPAARSKCQNDDILCPLARVQFQNEWYWKRNYDQVGDNVANSDDERKLTIIYTVAGEGSFVCLSDGNALENTPQERGQAPSRDENGHDPQANDKFLGCTKDGTVETKNTKLQEGHGKTIEGLAQDAELVVFKYVSFGS